jgi:prevent-host-death family protein
MKTMNLRDANQQFSRLVREVQATGEAILVLRNGKPAIRLAPVEERVTDLSRAQQLAKRQLMDPSSRFRTPDDWKFDRDEIYDQAVLRHSVVRRIGPDKGKKGQRGG